MELWDAYKADGSLAGCDLIRGEPIPEGLFHVVGEILVQHEDGSYLLMQRDWNKEAFPGKFDATAAGSALKGETARQAAFRELREETGIIASSLTPLYICVNRQSIYYGYLCVTNCDKASVTLQPGETISYRWVTLEEFLRFIDSDECVSARRERLSEYIAWLKRTSGSNRT